MTSLAKKLAIPECSAPLRKDQALAFQCGLLVADESLSSDQAVQAINRQHQIHHEQGHPYKGQWAISVTLDERGLSSSCPLTCWEAFHG